MKYFPDYIIPYKINNTFLFHTDLWDNMALM